MKEKIKSNIIILACGLLALSVIGILAIFAYLFIRSYPELFEIIAIVVPALFIVYWASWIFGALILRYFDKEHILDSALRECEGEK